MRTMGLHTAFVGPARPLVYGLLTRKDVCAENAEACLGAKAAAARRAARGGGRAEACAQEAAADAAAGVAELSVSVVRASDEDKEGGAGGAVQGGPRRAGRDTETVRRAPAR